MNYKPHWLIFSVWCVLLTICLLLLSNLKISTFDTYGDLKQQAMEIDFDNQFVSLLTARLGDVSGSVIHFTAKDCFCQTVAEQHVTSVKQLAINATYTNHTLELSSTDSLLLPSIPAVAVIDNNGFLRYLGPYSTGMFCAEGNGLVEAFILQEGSKQNRFGATIITDAKGCYCNLTKQRSL